MADQDDGGAGFLGEADQSLRRAAHLRDGAGRGFDHVGPHRLDRIDDDEARRGALGKRCDDVFNRSLGGQLHRSPGESKPFGSQPHLCDSLFTGDIDGTLRRLRQRRRHLDQQRGLADAWIAAEEKHRSAHEAAAGDAVEFRDAARQPRRVAGFAGKRFERKAPPLARRAAGEGGTLASLLADGIPFAARLAFALPAAVGGAAILADEGLVATGHVFACPYSIPK
jgi:hypothetical protein